jgi:hypothetical protein
MIANVSINKEPTLLHAFTSKILNTKYQKILMQLLDNEKTSPIAMNVLNLIGMTPFLAYLEHFTSNYVPLRGNLL